MTKYLIATSWSKEGEALYGKRWMEGFSRHWSGLCTAFVVTDDMLDGYNPFADFVRRNADRRLPFGSGYDYRQDLVRFAHKVYALDMAMSEAVSGDYDWIVWLDGDVETIADVTEDMLSAWLPDQHSGAILSRGFNPHPECGFIGFNLRKEGGRVLREVINLYNNDGVLRLPELHDSFVFGQAVITHCQHYGGTWHDLCPQGGGPDGLEAFGNSPLRSALVHHKGARKLAAAAPKKRSRYDLLRALIEHYKPLGVSMAGDPKWSVSSLGFDPGDLACGPPSSPTMLIVPHKEIELIKDAVRGKGDYDVVVFLEWYTIDSNLKSEDVTRFGANTVVPDAFVVESDEVADSRQGHVHLAVVSKIGYPDWLRRYRPVKHKKVHLSKEEQARLSGGMSTNFVVQTQNCRPDAEILANIKENMTLMTKWISRVKAHAEPAVIVSGGPSIKDPSILEEIRAKHDAGVRIFCVKHAYDWLAQNGIRPYAVILLDPRPYTGFSSHGASRAEMLKWIRSGDMVFAASMIDPSVTRMLLDRGCDVRGWHAAVGAGEAGILPPRTEMVLGGSSSAGRAISLLFCQLGFNNFTLYGYDCCHQEGTFDPRQRHTDGHPKYIEIELKVNGNAKKFWTDRDLLAQQQDLTQLLNSCPWIQWVARGPGMLSFLVENAPHSNPDKLPRFEDVYG